MARLKTRTVQHLLMLTPAEKADWKTKAAAAGMNLNQYIRHCVARRRIAPAQPTVNYQTSAQLGRIGNNLNQQIKAMNSALACGQELPNVLEAMQVVEEVHSLLKALQVELLGLRSDTKEDQEDDWQNN